MQDQIVMESPAIGYKEILFLESFKAFDNGQGMR